MERPPDLHDHNTFPSELARHAMVAAISTIII